MWFQRHLKMISWDESRGYPSWVQSILIQKACDGVDGGHIEKYIVQ